MTTLKPEHGYSLACLFAEPRSVDEFHEEGFAGLFPDRMEITIPEPTKSDREECGLPRRGDWGDADGAGEYQDRFFPLMNALWPVDLAYGRSEEEAAALMHRYGGATSLISIRMNDGDTSYFIAMTGGGMDLSWHLAGAYVACGCVPPIGLLESLRGSPFGVHPAATRAILAAGRQGVRHMQRKARFLAADLRALGKPRKKPAA